MQHSERFTELRREEKREERDRGDQEEKRGSQKRETDLVSNQFPMCSPQSGTPREVQSYIEKKRGRREIEITRRRRGAVKRGKTSLARNQFPKCSPQPRTPREIHRVR